jgi:hypothetical protein
MLDRYPSEDCIVAAKVREACTVAEKRMGEQIFLDRESLPDIHPVESRRACFSSLWFTGFWSLLSLFWTDSFAHSLTLHYYGILATRLGRDTEERQHAWSWT